MLFEMRGSLSRYNTHNGEQSWGFDFQAMERHHGLQQKKVTALLEKTMTFILEKERSQ